MGCVEWHVDGSGSGSGSGTSGDDMRAAQASRVAHNAPHYGAFVTRLVRREPIDCRARLRCALRRDYLLDVASEQFTRHIFV